MPELRPEDVRAELKDILDRAAGKTHSAEGPVMRCLADILTAHEVTVIAALTPQQAADALGAEWTVTPRPTWRALTASREEIERQVRAEVAEELTQIAREMQEMVNSAVTRHYASRIRVVLGEPSTCACFACVPVISRGGA